MPSLSVCVFSDHSPERLAAVVAPFREVADEIVVAIDDRVPDSDLTSLRDIADTILVAPFTWPLEANLQWLHSQCTGEWILRIDGDEVASAALVELLAGDEWHLHATYCYVPRRWLTDEGSSWITSNPWWPDLQLRLFKNQSGLLTFASGAHQYVKAEVSGSVLAAPIYHLDLIDAELRERRAKSRRYHQSDPHLRTHGGLAMGAYYAPELFVPPPSTEPVPEADRGFIDAAILKNHQVVQHQAFESAVPTVPTSPGRSASIDLVHPETRGFAGRQVELFVTIANTGTEELDPFAAAPFRLGCQWLTTEGVAIPLEARTSLPSSLESGTLAVASLVAEIPATPGDYRLSVGALDEGERWIARAPDIAFTAVGQPQITLVGGISRHRHLGDDLVVRSIVEELTDEFPQVRLVLLVDDPSVASERFGIAGVCGASRIESADGSPRLTNAAAVESVVDAARSHLAGQRVDDESVTDLADAIARSDLLVVAAAGSLASAYVDAALWPRLAEVEIASALGVPVVVTSAGIGPFTSDDHRAAARRLLSIAREVHVRDRRALEALADLEVEGPTTIVVPDAASGVQESSGSAMVDFLVDNGLDPERPYIVASARPEDDLRVLEQIAKSVGAAARALDAAVVLVPHCAAAEVDDRPALARLRGLFGTPIQVVDLDDIPPDELAADLVRNASVSIGSRFHNAVLSASSGHPSVLFCVTDYDQRRAEGLAEMSGTTIEVISGSARLVPRRTRTAVSRPTVRLRYPEPHPLITVVHALGVARRGVR